MAALVQTYPQQTTTVTMLPTRPSSSSGALGSSQSQHTPRSAQIPSFSPMNNPAGYRGLPSSNPTQQYAYNSWQHQTPHLRPENRTTSEPVVSHAQQNMMGENFAGSHRYAAAGPIPQSASFSNASNSGLRGYEDSSATRRPRPVDLAPRPVSAINLSTPSSHLTVNSTTSSRPSPDRYHRNQRKPDAPAVPNSAIPSGSGMAAVGHLYQHPGHSNSLPSFQSYQSFRGHAQNPGTQTRVTSVDDMSMPRHASDLAKRYRRRSFGSIEQAGRLSDHEASRTPSPLPSPNIQVARSESPQRRPQQDSNRQGSSHAHNGSTESVASTRSTRSSSRPSVSCVHSVS